MPAAGYGTAAGYGAGAATAQPAAKRKRRKGPLIAVLVLLAVVIAAGLFFVLKPKPSLSHSAVETFITSQYTATNVVCNGGKNITIKKGESFTCTADGGKSFTVVMLDAKGAYRTQRQRLRSASHPTASRMARCIRADRIGDVQFLHQPLQPVRVAGRRREFVRDLGHRRVHAAPDGCGSNGQVVQRRPDLVGSTGGEAVVTARDRGDDRLDRAEPCHQRSRGLLADAGDARQAVGRITAQHGEVRVVLGGHPVLRADLGGAHRLEFADAPARIEHGHAGRWPARAGHGPR